MRRLMAQPWIRQIAKLSVYVPIMQQLGSDKAVDLNVDEIYQI